MKIDIGRLNILKYSILIILSFGVSIGMFAQSDSSIGLAGEGPKGCQTNPNKNSGRCKKNINGEEYNCVSATSLFDCYSD